MGVHQATITNNFNRTVRTGRMLTSEETYGNGMNYTTNVLPEGYSKLLVNYKINENGTSISPRNGIKTRLNHLYSTDITHPSNEATVFTAGHLHWAGMMTLIDRTDEDHEVTYLVHAAVGFGEPHTGANEDYFLTNDKPYLDKVYAIFEEPEFQGKVINPEEYSTNKYSVAYLDDESNATIKGYHLNQSSNGISGIDFLKPVCTSCNGHLYVIANKGQAHIYRIDIIREWEEESPGHSRVVTHLSWDPIIPYAETPDAVSDHGANLLSNEPYDFEHEAGTVLTALGTTAFSIKESDIDPDVHVIKDHILYADIGETYRIKAYIRYDEDKHYQACWFVKDNTLNNDEDTKYYLRDWYDITPGGSDPDIFYDFLYSHESDTVFCGIREYHIDDNNEVVQDAYVEMSYIFLLNTGDTKLEYKYDLLTATHMLTYHQWIILWGVKGAENTLFSDYENMPSRFPAGKSLVTLDEPIVSVVNYLNNLLVFTTNKIYLITIGTDPGACLFSIATQQVISESIGILPVDEDTVTAVGKFVFFRSHDRFYMVTATVKSGVTSFNVAPCDIGIKEAIENLDTFVPDVLSKLYDYDISEIQSGWQIVRNYAITEDYTIKLNYLFNYEIYSQQPTNVCFSFIYNTQSYAWTLEIFELGVSNIPFMDVETKKISYYYTTEVEEVFNDTEQYRVHIGIAQSEYDGKIKDTLLLHDPSGHSTAVLNYQYLDTGARDIDKFHNKRFRELDLNFNNKSKEHLQFFLNYIIDNKLRQGSQTYTVEHNTDIPRPEPYTTDNLGDYCLFNYEAHDDENIDVMGTNELSPTTSLILDYEGFKDVDKVKVRFKISGKGYYTQYTLLSRQEKDYELLDHVWVCRPMFAR